MKSLKLFIRVLLPIVCLVSPLFLEINVHVGNYNTISYYEYLARIEKSKRQTFPMPKFNYATLELNSNTIISFGSPDGAKAATYLIWLVFASGPILIVLFFLWPFIRSGQIPKMETRDTRSDFNALENENAEFQKKYNIRPDDILGLEIGTFSLSPGRSVQIKRVYIKKTYEGFLEGRINKDYNSRLFQSLNYPKDWGGIKAFKFSPSQEQFTSCLKGAFISVWLTSHSPIHKEGSGSQLIVSWVDSFPIEEPLLIYIEKSLKNLACAELAEDFNY